MTKKKKNRKKEKQEKRKTKKELHALHALYVLHVLYVLYVLYGEFSYSRERLPFIYAFFRCEFLFFIIACSSSWCKFQIALEICTSGAIITS